MNQKDENCPAFQMVHLSLLTLIYCKEQNGRKLANKNFTTLAIQQKKSRRKIGFSQFLSPKW